MSQTPTHDNAPSLEQGFNLGPLLEQLQGSGYVETDPTFNLCPASGCVEIVDVLHGRQRSLFCARTEADDAMYALLETNGVPHMRRLWSDDEYAQYAVPNSARPLSRILLAEHPAQASNPTSMELAEVLTKTRVLLTRLAREAGVSPEQATWLKLAFSKANGGEVLLIPPLRADPSGSLEATLATLMNEGERLAAPGNVPKIRRAFSDS